MRWVPVAVLAVLLMAGCSEEPAEGPDVGIPATELEAGNRTQTMFNLAFAGGTREGELVISESYQPTDACLIGVPQCVGNAYRSFDLTPIIPAEVPVEMVIELTTGGNMDVGYALVEAQFIRVDEEQNGNTQRIDALLVRAPTGTVTLEVTYEFPGPDSTQGAPLEGTVHTVTRADVVPSFLPVAVELGPGDVVNATGDGLEHFVAYPPGGEPLRAVQFPFSLQVPDDGERGTYYLIGDADEALRLTGPNTTLSARLLQFVMTEPVDVTPNAETTFTLEVPGYPLHALVGLDSKPLPPGFLAGPTILGNHQVELVSPDNVDVLDEGTPGACDPPMCDFSVLRGIDWAYSSGFLDEYLKPGTYQAKVTMETSNDVQAYAFALYLPPA